MIATLRGTLTRRTPEAVVEVGGVGYRVFLPLTVFYHLPEEGSQVLLQVHTSVREDAIHLFGFRTSEEKEIFELLLGVSKVGPRLALNLLSKLEAADLRRVIAAGDWASLSRVPGIGRKTAERLVVELRDKIPPAPAAAPPPGPSRAVDARLLEDALGALVGLGYRKREAEEALRHFWETGERQLEALIRKSLAKLAP